MLKVKKQNFVDVKNFYLTTISNNLIDIIKPEDANYLAKVLVGKLDENELREFIECPILVIDAEENVTVDNAYIKKQLIRKNDLEMLGKLNKAKIIVCNCQNIAVKGLDIVLLMSNSIKVISANDNAVAKNDVFVARNNKIINSINIHYSFSSKNNFKNLLHSDIDNIKDTRVADMSVTSQIVCPVNKWKETMNVQAYDLGRGNIIKIFNPTENYNQIEQKFEKEK